MGRRPGCRSFQIETETVGRGGRDPHTLGSEHSPSRVLCATAPTGGSAGAGTRGPRPSTCPATASPTRKHNGSVSMKKKQ